MIMRNKNYVHGTKLAVFHNEVSGDDDDDDDDDV